jgi:DMSO reductase iron-sulfur subunit
MSTRPGFIVDLNKCTGCQACAMACQIENDLPPGRLWRTVSTFNELHVPGVELLHLSLACNHCAQAPCLEQCPARAYHRDERTGAVLIDQNACLGCGYCGWVCPFDAPQMAPERGVMTKCTFCVERQHEGLAPACVDSCPTTALGWGELTEADMVHEAPGFAQADIGPSIRIEPLQQERLLPVMTHPPAMPPWRLLLDRIPRRITLAHEWTLAVFTILVAVLVAAFTARQLGEVTLDGRVFLAVGLAGLLLSGSHLGRKERIWRAILQPDRSWLSREVLTVPTFLVAAAVVMLVPAVPAWWGWLVVIVGFGSLAVIDRVYLPARIRGSGPVHSAQVTGTGLLLAGALSGLSLVAVPVAAVKMVLYLSRRSERTALGLGSGSRLRLARSGLLSAGAMIMIFGNPWGRPVAIGCFLIAEMIDRAEYYDELEIETPASRQWDALAGRQEAVAEYP